MQDFKKLIVWQLAHRLALDAYRIIDRRFAKFPGLRPQMLRAAQSIASNIAEGAGADGAEFARFLSMSIRSSLEFENDLLLSRDLSILDFQEFETLNSQVDTVRRKTIALRRKLRGE